MELFKNKELKNNDDCNEFSVNYISPAGAKYIVSEYLSGVSPDCCVVSVKGDDDLETCKLLFDGCVSYSRMLSLIDKVEMESMFVRDYLNILLKSYGDLISLHEKRKSILKIVIVTLAILIITLFLNNSLAIKVASLVNIVVDLMYLTSLRDCKLFYRGFTYMSNSFDTLADGLNNKYTALSESQELDEDFDCSVGQLIYACGFSKNMNNKAIDTFKMYS